MNAQFRKFLAEAKEQIREIRAKRLAAIQANKTLQVEDIAPTKDIKQETRVLRYSNQE